MEADLHNAIGYLILLFRQKILKDAHNRFILYQLAKGLKFLHSAEIIHRDLKPSNIILSSKGLYKLVDFGISKKLDRSKFAASCLGTPYYTAPEILWEQ